MNPQEFWWTEDQQVTVTNPTEKTYKFKVHSKEYELGPHKTAKMPGYIAWVYVYGLSTQLVQADGFFNRWNEEGFRQEYYQKLVKDAEPVVQDVVTEEPNPIQHLDDEEEPAQAAPAPAAEAPASPAAADTTETASKEPEGDEEGAEPEEEPAEPSESGAGVKPMQPKAKALRSS